MVIKSRPQTSPMWTCKTDRVLADWNQSYMRARRDEFQLVAFTFVYFLFIFFLLDKESYLKFFFLRLCVIHTTQYFTKIHAMLIYWVKSFWNKAHSESFQALPKCHCIYWHPLFLSGTRIYPELMVSWAFSFSLTNSYDVFLSLTQISTSVPPTWLKQWRLNTCSLWQKAEFLQLGCLDASGKI